MSNLTIKYMYPNFNKFKKEVRAVKSPALGVKDKVSSNLFL